MDRRYSIKPYLTRLNNTILKASPDDLVGPTLENTSSSHQPVFIFNKQKFIGLISPQQAFLFERCPYLSRVKHCFFYSPHITIDTQLYEVAEYMLFRKIYTLPVFEDKNVKYVIKADTIFEKLFKNKKLLKEIENKLIIKKPIIGYLDSKIEDIFMMLLNKNISRVILVDKEEDLAGIVSRRDLDNALLVKTPRQRFGRREQNLRYSSYFDEEQVKRLDAPVTMFYTQKVLSVRQGESFGMILRKMKEVKKNSVVIVSGLKPVGFLSRHDILKAISFLRPIEEVQIIWEDSEKDVGEFTRSKMLNLLKKFGNRYKGKSSIYRIEIHVDAIKDSAGYKKLYYIRLHVDFQSGRLAFAYVETRDLVGGVREAIKRIKNQFDFSDRQKHEIF